MKHLIHFLHVSLWLLSCPRIFACISVLVMFFVLWSRRPASRNSYSDSRFNSNPLTSLYNFAPILGQFVVIVSVLHDLFLNLRGTGSVSNCSSLDHVRCHLRWLLMVKSICLFLTGHRTTAHEVKKNDFFFVLFVPLWPLSSGLLPPDQNYLFFYLKKNPKCEKIEGLTRNVFTWCKDQHTYDSLAKGLP